MKYKILIFCVLCFVISFFTNLNYNFTVDLGTDYAGILSTETSQSQATVSMSKYYLLNFVGYAIVIACVIGILCVFANACEINMFLAIIPVVILAILSYGATISMDALWGYSTYTLNKHFLVVFFIIIALFLTLKKSSGSFLVASICILIMLFLIANSGPTCVLKSRWPARQKACYSNIRVITSAIEMYNMDIAPMMANVDLETLKSKGYLKGIPECPEDSKNPYLALGDLTKKGVVSCGNDPIGATASNLGKNGHGTIDGGIDYIDPEEQRRILEEEKRRKKEKYIREFTLSDFFADLLGKPKPY